MEVGCLPPDPHRRNPHSYAAILDATIDLLTNVGYNRLTIERVAAQAGVGKATVYRWWPSKARLVVEAMTERYEFNPVVPNGDLRSEVRELVERAIEFMVRTPMGHALPQLAADLDDEPDARSLLIKWLGPTRAAHLAVLYSAAGRGDLPHDIDADLVLDVIAGAILYRNLLGQEPDDRLVEQLTSLIVDCELPRSTAADGRLV
jgi:AcrR family transcriptional regulator